MLPTSKLKEKKNKRKQVELSQNSVDNSHTLYKRKMIKDGYAGMMK